MQQPLKGKVAIVTGAAGGIGAAHARAIGAAGGQVIVADIDPERGDATALSLRGEGFEAAFVEVDISSPSSIEQMVARTVALFGRIDFLVNNAALFGGMRLDGLVNIEMDYFRRFMDINFYGCLHTTRAVVPEMRRQGGGAIINQSSTAAYMPMGPYSVSKAAMNALTFSLARELGPLNIRVNGIAPGPTDTNALREMRQRVSGPGAKLTAEGIPLGRLGSPHDIANAAVFLLSDQAAWITGHVLNVDGGQLMRI